MGNDLVERQSAIDALTHKWDGMVTSVFDVVNSLPSAQPDLDEWCTDCKEYDKERNSCPRWNRVIKETLKDLQEERKTQLSEESTTSDYINRCDAIDAVKKNTFRLTFAEEQNCEGHVAWSAEAVYSDVIEGALLELPSAQPECAKYEYHYDHTDCIWYRPEARNRCPTTCAQYRDGWNDAMNYIFRDGKGYRPFRRDRHYEE